MYNLEVQGNHDFFVGENGWLVHNKKSDSLVPFVDADGRPIDRKVYIEQVARRYGINLKGSGVSFEVIYDESMLLESKYDNASAITRFKNGIATIHISPSAFDTSDPIMREATIADNLAHELYHARNYVNGNAGGSEETAVIKGRSLREYVIRKFGGC